MGSAGVELWHWVALVAFILLLLAFDLIRHRDGEPIAFRSAVKWSCFYFSIGLLFGLLIWLTMGSVSAGEYYAGLIVETSLSADNVFVFALIFSYFSVPDKYQHKVLFWGILGAVVFRAIFIIVGAELLESFDWMFVVFGGFLIFTGIRMAFHDDSEIHPEHNPVLRLIRSRIPMTKSFEGDSFFVRHKGVLMATPLFAVLVVVETTDVIFAVDSVPAILAITTDRFIVFSANAFAILGLRSLYFVLVNMIKRFIYLDIGLSLILVLIGLKMLADYFLGFHPPVYAFLITVTVIIGLSVALSLYKTRGQDLEQPDALDSQDQG